MMTIEERELILAVVEILERVEEGEPLVLDSHLATTMANNLRAALDNEYGRRRLD